MSEAATLIFLLQQLGMSLGLGAVTLAGAALFIFRNDADADEQEQHFISAAKTVMAVALFLLIATGGLVTGAHLLAGETEIVFTPVYLCKWLLLLVLLVVRVFARMRAIPRLADGILTGATWYALFVVHTLAPDLSWGVLGLGYLLWLAIFGIGFALLSKSSFVPKVAAPPSIPKPQAPVIPKIAIAERKPPSFAAMPQKPPQEAPKPISLTASAPQPAPQKVASDAPSQKPSPIMQPASRPAMQIPQIPIPQKPTAVQPLAKEPITPPGGIEEPFVH